MLVAVPALVRRLRRCLGDVAELRGVVSLRVASFPLSLTEPAHTPTVEVWICRRASALSEYTRVRNVRDTSLPTLRSRQTSTTLRVPSTLVRSARYQVRPEGGARLSTTYT